MVHRQETLNLSRSKPPGAQNVEPGQHADGKTDLPALAARDFVPDHEHAESHVGQTAFAPAAPMRAMMPSWNIEATAGTFALAMVFMVVRPMYASAESAVVRLELARQDRGRCRLR